MRRRTVARIEHAIQVALITSVWLITSAMAIIGLASM